jgi:hypothetical protein
MKALIKISALSLVDLPDDTCIDAVLTTLEPDSYKYITIHLCDNSGKLTTLTALDWNVTGKILNENFEVIAWSLHQNKN